MGAAEQYRDQNQMSGMTVARSKDIHHETN